MLLWVVEEVGHSGEGQEENPGPPHCHLHPEGQGPEGVRHHRNLPREEGGARGVIHRDGAGRGSALPLQSRAAH